MILDVLENAHRYLVHNKGFSKAIEFLFRPDLKELQSGEYEIDGGRVYAIVAKETGRKEEDASLEIHEKYIDIQLVLAGTDNMGWKSKSSCKKTTGEYDKESDVQFFADDPDVTFSVKPGSFVVFFPEDAHMPSISEGKLHKVIVKVAVGDK